MFDVIRLVEDIIATDQSSTVEAAAVVEVVVPKLVT